MAWEHGAAASRVFRRSGLTRALPTAHGGLRLRGTGVWYLVGMRRAQSSGTRASARAPAGSRRRADGESPSGLTPKRRSLPCARQVLVLVRTCGSLGVGRSAPRRPPRQRVRQPYDLHQPPAADGARTRPRTAQHAPVTQTSCAAVRAHLLRLRAALRARSRGGQIAARAAAFPCAADPENSSGRPPWAWSRRAKRKALYWGNREACRNVEPAPVTKSALDDATERRRRRKRCRSTSLDPCLQRARDSGTSDTSSCCGSART